MLGDNLSDIINIFYPLAIDGNNQVILTQARLPCRAPRFDLGHPNTGQLTILIIRERRAR